MIKINFLSPCFSARMLIAFMLIPFGGCTKNAPSAPPTIFGAENSTSPAPLIATTRKLLYVSNVLTQVHALHDQDFLMELLLKEIVVSENSEKTTIEQIAMLKPQDVAARAEILFGSHHGPASASLTGSNWDEISLLTSIQQAKTDLQILGKDQARTNLETNLQNWGIQIVDASADIDQDESQLAYQSSVNQLLAERLKYSDNLAFSPHATIQQLSQILPHDLQSTALAKKYLSNPQGDSGRIIQKLESLTFQDFNSTRNEINQLIGTPTLTKEEAFLRGGLVFHKVDAAVTLASFMIGDILGDAGAAKKFNIVTKDGIAIAKAVAGFQFGKIGADFATGNVIGGVTDIVSNLTSIFGLGGPSEDDQILQGIASVRQDLADLHADMSKNFNEVFQRLDQVNQKLDEQLNLLMTLQKTSAEVLTDVQNISNQVTGLTLYTESGFETLLVKSFHDEYQACLGPLTLSVSATVPPTAHDALVCLNEFTNEAIADSMTGVRNGLDLSTDGAQTNLHNLNSANAEVELGLLVNLINKLVIKNNFESEIDVSVGEINPADWQAGTEAYLQMRLLFPFIPSSGNFELQTLEDIQDTGQQLQQNLRALSNPQLIKDILNTYDVTFHQQLSAPNELSLANLSTLRQLLNVLVELSYHEQKMTDPDLSPALGTTSPERLPDSDQMDQMSWTPLALSEIELQEEIGLVGMTRFLDDLIAAPSDGNTPTLIDHTLERLNVYLEMVEAE